MMARRWTAAYAAAVLCLVLSGCASEPAPATSAQLQPAAVAPPPEPELTAPPAEPETAAAQVAPKPARKLHKTRKPAPGDRHRVAKAAPPLPSFRCHIVREAALEGAAAFPPGTEPAKVDLYARVDPQARTLTVERAGDPAFAQSTQHCGDGKPSPVSVKKKGKRRSRR